MEDLQDMQAPPPPPTLLVAPVDHEIEDQVVRAGLEEQEKEMFDVVQQR